MPNAMRKSYQRYGYAILFLFIFSHTSICFAQITLTGKVTDAKNNPVGFANISIFGTYEGTVTDDSGRFELHTGQKTSI